MQDKTTLPGDPRLYEPKPPRVDYYDVFYLETRLRDMMEEYNGPFAKAIKADKEAFIQLRYDYDQILERMHELEHFAMIQEWKLRPSRQWAALRAEQEQQLGG